MVSWPACAACGGAMSLTLVATDVEQEAVLYEEESYSDHAENEDYPSRGKRKGATDATASKRHQPKEHLAQPFGPSGPVECAPSDALESQRSELEVLIKEKWFRETFLVTQHGVACRVCIRAANGSSAKGFPLDEQRSSGAIDSETGEDRKSAALMASRGQKASQRRFSTPSLEMSTTLRTVLLLPHKQPLTLRSQANCFTVVRTSTEAPTPSPSFAPTVAQTASLSVEPTAAPTAVPTPSPSNAPTDKVLITCRDVGHLRRTVESCAIDYDCKRVDGHDDRNITRKHQKRQVVLLLATLQ